MYDTVFIYVTIVLYLTLNNITKMAEKQVEYNFLGKSGLKVSNIALGTMTFGKDDKSQFGRCSSQADDDLSYKIMDRYSELGGNFMDTANAYGFGKSEEIVGNWLARHERDRMVIATKVRYQMDSSNVNKIGLSRRHIVESCQESLERLKTHYIDIYQSHCWDSATPVEETLRTFDDLIRSGKIRYFGASNVCGWQLQKIVDLLEKMGLNSCISLQQQYNLLIRQSEFEEFMVCKNEGIGVLPWSPLKGGLLTGKFKRTSKPEETKSRLGHVLSTKSTATQAAPSWNDYVVDEKYWDLMSSLERIANNHGKTIPQVAIRWLIQKETVSSVIIGATSISQLEDNMGASSGWELSLEEMKELDDVSPRSNHYPYEMIWRVNATRANPFC